MADSLDEKVSVTVIEVFSPEEMYASLTHLADKLEELSIQIQRHCVKSRPMMAAQIKQGTDCLAKFTDDMWYRATVTG